MVCITLFYFVLFIYFTSEQLNYIFPYKKATLLKLIKTPLTDFGLLHYSMTVF